jgi:general secretion pathway protein K
VRTDRFVGNQSGLALVLALVAISFLVAVTMQFMITIDRQVSVSTIQREQVRLDSMVLAGLHLARAALLADQLENKFDSPQDNWAAFDQEKIKALAGDVDLSVTVTDLSGRLQLNTLGNVANKKYREIWQRFLLSGRFAIANEDEAEALLDALGDWIDSDDKERPQGAEEPYYQSLKPPYSCKNDRITFPEELLLVKGMTPRIIYGDKNHEGIIEYITVMGDDGKVNLNTAPLPVLQALSPEMTPGLAQDLLNFREDRQRKEVLATTGWYRQVSGFPSAINLGNDVLKVTSNSFNIKVSAAFHQYRRTGTGMLLRAENQEQTLLSWKIE